LYSLFNIIRDKGKIVSAWGQRGEGGGGGVREKRGRNDPNIVCTYK
jgi:hypothetical protein